MQSCKVPFSATLELATLELVKIGLGRRGPAAFRFVRGPVVFVLGGAAEAPCVEGSGVFTPVRQLTIETASEAIYNL